MDLHVRRTPEGWTAVLDDGTRWPCTLGRAGVTSSKREGDGATPAGSVPVRRVLYRPDRVVAPASGVPVLPIASDDAWCDDPASEHYNRPVKTGSAASHENLWREDRLYDLLVVLGHNDDPPVPRNGSAIFVHRSPPGGGATAGCIGLPAEAVTHLVAQVTAESHVRVHAPA